MSAAPPRLVAMELTGGGLGSDVCRVTISLLPKASPKALKNFLHLIQGPSAVEGDGGAPAAPDAATLPLLAGSAITRVVPEDCVEFGTSATKSIFGGFYESEAVGPLSSKHDQPGILSVNNFGPNTNASKYFITLRANSSLDGHHLVLGRVISGMETLFRIAKVKLTPQGAPREKIVIRSCRVVAPPTSGRSDREPGYKHKFATGGVRRRGDDDDDNSGGDDAERDAEEEGGASAETAERRDRRLADGAVAKRKRGEMITQDESGTLRSVATAIPTTGGERFDYFEAQGASFATNIDDVVSQQRDRLAKQRAKENKSMRFASKLKKSKGAAATKQKYTSGGKLRY